MLNACSKEKDDGEPHPEYLVSISDDVKDVAPEGLDITFKRMRVWETKDAPNARGSLYPEGQLYVELRYTLAGETAERRYTVYGYQDSEGNLYTSDNEPGIVTEADIGQVAGDTPPTCTTTAADAFIQSDFPDYLIRNDSTKTGANTSTKLEWIDTSTIEGTPWTNFRNRRFTSSADLATRTKWEKNTDLAIKAKTGCVVNAGAANGDIAAKTFVFGDVELGDTLGHTGGALIALTPDTGGDDDTLWIKWSNTWKITGVNVKTKTIRIMHAKSAPFYNKRELPGVDASNTDPKISGYESLVRACNSAAAAVSGRFQMLGLGNEFTVELLGSSAAHCAPLKVAASSTDAAIVKRIDLSNSDYDNVNVANESCNWTVPVSFGTWDGTTHQGPVNQQDSDVFHGTQSPITSVTFN
jgi:hypothetical protein